MSAQTRLHCPNSIRLIVPAINRETIEAGRRLDALETLIFSEPDPDIRSVYVRHFNDLWDEIAG